MKRNALLTNWHLWKVKAKMKRKKNTKNDQKIEKWKNRFHKKGEKKHQNTPKKPDRKKSSTAPSTQDQKGTRKAQQEKEITQPSANTLKKTGTETKNKTPKRHHLKKGKK